MDISPGDANRIETIRRFNRFYTRRIGVLHEGLLQSPYSLAETRVLWELAHAEEPDGPTVGALARRLNLDTGYLSRLLRGLKERGLVRTARSDSDARQQHLGLSPAGRRAFAPLEQRSQQEVAALLAPLTEAERHELVQSLARVERLLDDPTTPAARTTYLLRPHRAGDLGWVVARHGALYAQEYQLDLRFEALVARIAADFIEHFDARREACWIAERDGSPLGCVCLVQARDDATRQPLAGIAQLRLLLVEPAARGLGLGSRLVAECTRFARDAGYRRIRLWTQSNLQAARAIYRREGYTLVASEPHRSFGHEQVAETWELPLS